MLLMFRDITACVIAKQLFNGFLVPLPLLPCLVRDVEQVPKVEQDGPWCPIVSITSADLTGKSLKVAVRFDPLIRHCIADHASPANVVPNREKLCCRIGDTRVCEGEATTCRRLAKLTKALHDRRHLARFREVKIALVKCV